MNEERWEYRIWADSDSQTSDAIQRAGDERTAEYRTDTYLLAKSPEMLPKVRDGKVLEVKCRLSERDGLEEWGLQTCAEFPVSEEELSAYPSLFGQAACRSASELTYRAASNGLLVASVRKHRRLFDIENVRVEITEVFGGGLPPLTFALEGALFEATRALAERLGLAKKQNTDYGTALRAAH